MKKEIQFFRPDADVLKRIPDKDALGMAMQTVLDENKLGTTPANLPNREGQIRDALRTADEALDRLSAQAEDRRTVERMEAQAMATKGRR